MAFPPGFLDELRGRIALGDLVGRRVRLQRRGRQSQGLCPFHNEKTPSFYVFDDHFHCFGCGAHGDAIGFVMRAEHLDFIAAVERLAGEAGIPVPQPTPQERERAERQKTLLEALAAAAACYEAQLWSPAGARAREYLARRGLAEATIRRFRLGWAPDSRENGDRQTLRRALAKDFPEALLVEAGLLRVPEEGSPYDYFRARVIFPIGDRAGRPIAFGGRTLGEDQPKYLNSPDTPLFEKGRVLYGWAAARADLARQPEAAAILVEGYMDAIALSQAGFGGAVAPLGTALTEMQLHELWRLSPEPVVCFDGDPAGQRAARRALDRALPLLRPGMSLRFAALPPGDDPDSLVRAAGPAAFAAVLRAARPLSEMLWRAELAARPVDTPERRADLERRLMAAAGQIADRAVQGEYRRFYAERLYRLFRGAPDRARSGARGAPFRPPIRPDFAPDFAPPGRPGRRNREVFLGILVRHPALIEDWIEEIAAIDIPEPELDSLRRAILGIPDSHPGLDAAALQQHLASCGHAEILSALTNTMARHAGFAAPGGDDPEVIRRGLTEALQLLRAGAASDRQEAAQALAAEASEENWQRLKALKDREAQDGPVGGFVGPAGDGREGGW